MTSRNRVIIDTDPGVDDTLALLLALAAKPEELEILLISVTFGNVEVENCLRNVVSMFHVIEKELEWRRQRGQPEGFETMKRFKPIVAIGAEEPLEDQRMMADYFHGTDGLAGIHSSHPHLHPSSAWQHLFDPPPTPTLLTATAPLPATDLPPSSSSSSSSPLYTPSHVPSHHEILRLLRTNPPGTITIIAIGPLTTLALAAASDPTTFLRAKDLVVMAGALAVPGNITPVAEFNTYADAIAAARVFALTSPRPESTLPPMPPGPSSPVSSETASARAAPLYPATLPNPLHLSLFPLDITTPHLLRRSTFAATIAPLRRAGSPLAEWVDAFLSSTFRRITTLYPPVPNSLATTAEEERERERAGEVGLNLHDPLCVWYLLTRGEEDGWGWAEGAPEDVRVETVGQWTRGMCVVDRRGRLKVGGKKKGEGEGGEEEEGGGDEGRWLDVNCGNRIWRAVRSPEPPGMEGFGKVLLERIFG